MAWNWQQPDWPNFSWDSGRLARAEEHFLRGGGVLVGTVRHLGQADQEQLTVEAISTEAVTTSEIEGEMLDRASVQSSIRKQLGLATDNRRIGPAEQGIAEMMVDLYRAFAAPLSDEILFAWHRMLMHGRRDLKDIGRYRTDKEAMQVVSGALHAPEVHFEAPPSKDVPREMARFVRWFNRTAPDGGEPLPALTRAGIAHLYFVSIHPFEDGNGRIARAIAEKALAQGLGQPTLTALAATILTRRKAYYTALEAANKCNQATAWLAWFAAITIEAQMRTIAWADFLIDKTRLLDRLRVQLNERQEKALLRILREGPKGFKGGLSAGNYVSITGASPATATRDLADMVAKGALLRHGERRHARYQVAIPLRPIVPVVLDESGGLQNLMDDAEMLADVRAYDAAKARIERGRDELIPLEITEGRLAGESPVKIWREYRGLTQEDLAKASKVSGPMIAAIEARHKTGGIPTLKKIAAALNVDLDHLA